MRFPFKSLRIVIIVFAVSCCLVERTSADEATGSRTDATGAEPFEGGGEPISFGFQRHGFFNGGGGKSYRVHAGRLTMDWERGNNTGDVFFPGPKEFQCLVKPQDSVQVDVRVNRDGEAIGDGGGGLYRSGPGLYLAQNRGGQAGMKGRHSISFERCRTVRLREPATQPRARCKNNAIASSVARQSVCLRALF